MKQNNYKYIIAGTVFILAGCETATDTLKLKREPLTLKQQAALAVDEDYQSALRTISVNGKSKSDATSAPQAVAGNDIAPAPYGNSFGPRIGQYFLADDYVVYRHAKPQVIQNTTPPPSVAAEDNFPQAPVQTSGTSVALTYFLVSPSGTVDDYATGTLGAAQPACIQIAAGQAIICDDTEKLSADFDMFDRTMITSKGLGINSWNVSENAVLTPAVPASIKSDAATPPPLPAAQ